MKPENGLMIHRDLAFRTVGANHLAAKFVDFEVLRRGIRRDKFPVGMAAGQHSDAEHKG